MATPVEMPKMSDTMEEGVLVSWLADEGDSVASGDVIAQVETDKATMDLEVYDDGVLLKRVAEEGARIPIGGLIAVLGKEGEDVSDLLAQYGAGGAGEKKEEKEEKGEKEEKEEKDEKEDRAAGGAKDAVAGDGASTEQEPEPREQPVEAAASETPTTDGGKVKASPLARRIAAEQGVELGRISGTGPEGRIIKRDVETALGRTITPRAPERAPADRKPAERAPERPAHSKPAARASGKDEGFQSTPISQMRKTIARRLAESKFTAPHFYLTLEVDMARIGEARRRVNELLEAQDRPKVSVNDFVTKACAVALRLHPAVNSSYLEKEGEIRRHGNVHVAVAVAVEEGLLTPVVRDADRKGLAQIAEETRDLAERARKRQLQPQDWEGSTFTTSNLGMFGIEEFTAIINPPNACILAIGAIREVPIVDKGQITVGSRMKVTLSCDHRVVDGATGAQFLADVKRFLEEPMNMLL
jgi:pyruvate dehydrogenase E2 component (dihydrolipoamide acetyltransferase)